MFIYTHGHGCYCFFRMPRRSKTLFVSHLLIFYIDFIVSFFDLIAHHKKGVIVTTTKISNKSQFLANVNVLWFPDRKKEFPFPT